MSFYLCITLSNDIRQDIYAISPLKNFHVCKIKDLQ